MIGVEFCEILQAQMGARNPASLAKVLGVAPASLTIMKSKEELGKLQIANFVKRVVEAKSKDILKQSMEVVEYFPIDTVKKTNVGIYSFYNSEGRIIYLGKAEKNLFSEMIQTYNRAFNGNYIIFAVGHPRNRFKSKPDGTVRKITRQTIKLADTASFFSVYKVQNYLILPLEALLIRFCANNLINTRMENQLYQVGFTAVE